MKKTIILVIVLTVSLALLVFAVTPEKWTVREFSDYISGKFNGISVTGDGMLLLAPQEDIYEGPPEEFYLSFLETPDGTRFLGTGHAGAVYQIDQGGNVELYYKVPEMDITCLARDSRGNLYAGSSPNGKIYRITGKNEGEEFFDPQEKYIWDLLVNADGNLLAAVGEDGGIYEITPDGVGGKILEVEENHILCMLMTPEDQLLAGSGGGGAVYRMEAKKKAAILFETPYEEVKSLAFDSDGVIYAASGGKKGSASGNSILSRIQGSQSSAAASTSVTVVAEKSSVPQTASEGDHPGAVYRIKTDGTAEAIWTSDQDLVYTVLWDDSAERILFGTGKRGRLYTINKEEEVSLLLQKDSEQIYLLQPADIGIHILTNNPSQWSLMQSEQRFEGDYTSKVMDAEGPADWGRITWGIEQPGGTQLQFQTRSGNSEEPNQTWSNWSPPYQQSGGEQILNPKGRYLQFKILFKTNSGQVSPKVNEVNLFYQQTNLSPKVDELIYLPPNVVFQEPPDQDEKIWGLKEDEKEIARTQNNNNLRISKKLERQGFQTIMWKATDPNEDSLLYSVFIKKEGENQWRRLQKKWNPEIFVFNTLTLPDGEYRVKISASDIASNPQGKALSAEKISRPFTIDNSRPDIQNFSARRQGSLLKITFTAADAYSVIKEVQYLVRPEGWQVVFPKDGISDAKEELFEFIVPLPNDFDNMITVKVTDDQGNVGVARSEF